LQISIKLNYRIISFVYFNLSKKGDVLLSLLIKNGYLLNPSNELEGNYDLFVDGDKIVQVEPSINREADTIIDANGMYIMPGFIDLHVHLREPGFEYKETISTGAMSAAKGGYTTICPMPNTNPTIDNKYMVEYLKLKSKEEAVINILPVGSVTKGQLGTELSDISGMANAGAVAISEDGKSVMNTSIYLEGMKAANLAGIPVFAHCEDKDLVKNGVINAGEKARELDLPGISNAVEDIIVARDILLAKETGVKLHLCHCSTEKSVTFIKMAKEEGLPVTGEVCPHHFTMSDDEIPNDDANYKMNPPLRSRADVDALKEGLKSNILDVIATDHAPHSMEEKEQSFRTAPFGIVGLETAFSLTMTELVNKGYLTPMQMVEKMSLNPARVLGINKGSLEIGKIADIVIADPNESYKIDVNGFVSKGKNTPFHGKEVVGKVKYTIVSGEVVYQEYR
jgi:dihydroorotase